MYTKTLAVFVLFVALASQAFAGHTVNKSVCTSGLVGKGACTAGQVGNFVNTAGRSTLHYSFANADLVELRDRLCPSPPQGETQNQCLDRIIGERLKAWIADAAIADACATANPNPDVD